MNTQIPIPGSTGGAAAHPVFAGWFGRREARAMRSALWFPLAALLFTGPFFIVSAGGAGLPAKPNILFSPEKYWDLYDPAKIPLAANPFYPADAPKYAILPGGELRSYDGVPAARHLPDAYARQLKLGYYAAVSYMDAQVGRVLAELDRSGMRDQTIIILWGDHGWKLGEHDAWTKHSNVENDTRAPLMISFPGMATAGKHTDALVEFVDIFPTLLEKLTARWLKSSQ